MTVGEYDDADKNCKCCDDFHRRRGHVIEDKIEDKTCERKCEFKNGSYGCWGIFETPKIEC
jgi:hypothetical protein